MVGVNTPMKVPSCSPVGSSVEALVSVILSSSCSLIAYGRDAGDSEFLTKSRWEFVRPHLRVKLPAPILHSVVNDCNRGGRRDAV